MRTDRYKKYLTVLLIVFTSLFFGSNQVVAIVNFPDVPDTFYYDQINVLSTTTKGLVEQKNSYYQNKKNAPQIVVAVISSTEDEDIDSYASDLFQKWKIGSKSKDNGVLILYALNNGKRNVRIEVGYGLEGDLTDNLAAQILNENKGNLKSENDEKVNQGLQKVFKAVAGVVDRSNGYQTADSKVITRPRNRINSKAILLIILLLVYLILIAFDKFKYDRKRHVVLILISILFLILSMRISKILWLIPLIYLWFNQSSGGSGYSGGSSSGGFFGGGSSGGSSSGGGFSGGGGSSGGGGASI
ncbi:TPM domain-containing protein [Xylocopilactobacillus apis]|uniref:TPM domain-containing protein n=1 Tax=Xylocopilactobacillus apis TaxID=2932183 RepID=A0AAU9CTQ6_9LACO|nr:TPM domain-containing protein [Xylocopilactobacillus apis]BDR57389.1 hypothetical protein KIMC2_19510 [Xylocopilactobacillus apis]